MFAIEMQEEQVLANPERLAAPLNSYEFASECVSAVSMGSMI